MRSYLGGVKTLNFVYGNYLADRDTLRVLDSRAVIQSVTVTHKSNNTGQYAHFNFFDSGGDIGIETYTDFINEFDDISMDITGVITWTGGTSGDAAADRNLCALGDWMISAATFGAVSTIASFDADDDTKGQLSVTPATTLSTGDATFVRKSCKMDLMVEGQTVNDEPTHQTWDFGDGILFQDGVVITVFENTGDTDGYRNMQITYR